MNKSRWRFMKRFVLLFCIILSIGSQKLHAASILIPMDESQKNHLKSYGIAYWMLQHDLEMFWLVNYR